MSGATGESVVGGAPATGRVPALLVMHADLAAALMRAAAAVYGPIEDLRVLSNQGYSREALEDLIDEAVSPWRQGGLVLTDFWGGSCHTCGLAAARGRGEVMIVTGVNLPMLLDYLHNRESFAVGELAERLQQK
ncbi:MAG TPA: hypothetical protein VLV15_07925, partial [Dongiaceae bacterium]|nr:hypothetical protein [Dongiaceae bacterium]